MLNTAPYLPLWDRLKISTKPVIIYGMGDGAQKILNVMEQKGIKPSGFMASDEFVRGHSFAGFEVKKLSDIEKEFGAVTILVAFGTSIPEVMERIKEISVKQELYAPDVPVIGGGLFDKDYFAENEDKINEVYEMLADDKSREVFEGWLNYRLTGRINFLLDNQTDKAEAYELLSLTEDEIYADLGAYTGDTVSEFLEVTGYKFGRIYAVEPDARNYAKMKRNHYKLSPYDFYTYNAGAWNEDCVKQFVQKGGRNSSLIPYEKGRPINPSMLRDIEMRSLDSILGGNPATLVKYDVEGSESEAIDGSRETIGRYKPKLIVSLYHRTEDMFALPLKIKQIRGDYKFYLRQHPYIPAWDMNLYCI